MITTHSKRFALSTAILATCAAGGAPAKDADVRNALAPCIEISSSADRLACYDKLAGRVSAPKALAAAPAPSAPAPSAPAAASPAPATPVTVASVAAAPAPAAAPTEEDFGRSKVRKARTAASSGAPPEIKSITAKVAAFGRSPGAQWLYLFRPERLMTKGMISSPD